VLLARAHWGQGLGGEAAHSVAEHARTAFGVPVVYATVDADHGRSIGMLGRAGFRHVGTEVDDEGPYEVFAYGADLAAGAAASQTAAGR
jgi:ribosomal-protein-alanine N-acetyltransferase